MLTELKISNFAIAENLEIEFKNGFSTITGETGAGKSIMIDALALTLGGRADTAMVGPHGEKANITASFDISKTPTAKHWLDARSLDADGECILRRVVSRDGKSRAFINGTPSPLQDIKSLAECLINIHSQHQHQQLLKKENHRQLLDNYCNHSKTLEEIRTCFKDWQSAQQSLRELEENQGKRVARVEFLRFQLEELDQLELTENEYQSLNEEHRKLANVDQDLIEAHEALMLLEQSEENDVMSMLNRVHQLYQGLSQKHLALKPALQGIDEALIQLEESSRDLQQYMDELENDPDRLAEVDKKLSDIHRVARKHHKKPEELYQYRLELLEELDSLENSDVSLSHLGQQCESLKAHYLELAQSLSATRKKVARKLDKLINRHLAELGMEQASITSQLTDLDINQARAHGLDDMEWLISTNPGQAPQALGKIASGGELSRISLAIQVCLAEQTSLPCLVFDEVDVGIGGATADVVGRLLRELGKHSQIICITHLAQVAAQGQQHFRIEKHSEENSVRTLVSALNKKQRVEEIARMMGGSELTRTSQSHAREMLASA